MLWNENLDEFISARWVSIVFSSINYKNGPDIFTLIIFDILNLIKANWIIEKTDETIFFHIIPLRIYKQAFRALIN